MEKSTAPWPGRGEPGSAAPTRLGSSPIGAKTLALHDMERTRGFKFAWLAFLLLQLGLPSWSVIADAQLLRPQPLGIHLESNACVPSHPDDCALCNFLQTPVELPAEASPTTPLASAHVDRPAEAVSPPIGSIAAAPLPRAPPQA